MTNDWIVPLTLYNWQRQFKLHSARSNLRVYTVNSTDSHCNRLDRNSMLNSVFYKPWLSKRIAQGCTTQPKFKIQKENKCMYFLDSFVVFLVNESPESSGNPIVESSELKTVRNPESRIPNRPKILFGPNPRFQKSPRPNKFNLDPNLTQSTQT